MVYRYENGCNSFIHLSTSILLIPLHNNMCWLHQGDTNLVRLSTWRGEAIVRTSARHTISYGYPHGSWTRQPPISKATYECGTIEKVKGESLRLYSDWGCKGSHTPLHVPILRICHIPCLKEVLLESLKTRAGAAFSGSVTAMAVLNYITISAQ